MCLFLSWCEEVLRFGDVDLSNAPTLFVSFHHIYAVKLYQNLHDRDINLCKRFCNTHLTLCIILSFKDVYVWLCASILAGLPALSLLSFLTHDDDHDVVYQRIHELW